MLDSINTLIKNKISKSEKELKTIKDSCCSNISFKVIDFDLVKDKFYENLCVNQSNKLCSADAILFRNSSTSKISKDELVFIEMKKYDKFGKIKLEEFVEDRLKKFPDKINDSIFILIGLVGYYNIKKEFYQYFFNPSQLNLKAVFVCNFNHQEYNRLTLLSLTERRISITKRVDNNIQILTCDMFSETYKP